MTLGQALREWTIVLAAAPVLAFPLTAPPATIAILFVVVAWILLSGPCNGSRLSEHLGALRWPWTVLAGMMLVGVVASPYRVLTLPKLAGMVLGMLLLRAVLLTATTALRARALAWGYLALGTATVTAALLIQPDAAADDFNLTYVKYPALWAITLKIPHVVKGLSGAERGVNLNALGGTTLLFFPLAVLGAAALVPQTFRRGGRSMAVAGLAAAAMGVISLGLLLSQSRTSWVSGAAALALVSALAIAVRWPRVAAVLAAAAAMATAAFALWLWQNPPALSSGLVSFQRTDAWRVGFDALRLHPVTGVGLGAFRRLAEVMQIGVPNPIIPLDHAHNVFLQTALDVGLPGLGAYVGLLGAATGYAFQVWSRASSGVDRALALGLWGGLVAVHLFGIMDAIALGAKVGIFVWANVGLLAALHRACATSSTSQAV